MEQYFKAARVPEEEQASIASMYLVGDAKLWWQSRLKEDAEAQRQPIKSRESLKGELKGQFLLGNARWIAWENLKKLEQTGSVRDYVKEFSSLMLDIKNMSDEDKLFNFISGLQPWAQTELRRQVVRDLPSKRDGRRNKGVSKKSKSGDSQEKKDLGCFICDGPHRAKDCPKRDKINAMVKKTEVALSVAEASTSRMNPLQLMNALREEVVDNNTNQGPMVSIV